MSLSPFGKVEDGVLDSLSRRYRASSEPAEHTGGHRMERGVTSELRVSSP